MRDTLMAYLGLKDVLRQGWVNAGVDAPELFAADVSAVDTGMRPASKAAFTTWLQTSTSQGMDTGPVSAASAPNSCSQCKAAFRNCTWPKWLNSNGAQIIFSGTWKADRRTRPNCPSC